jgi:hypothetical protein
MSEELKRRISELEKQLKEAQATIRSYDTKERIHLFETCPDDDCEGFKECSETKLCTKPWEKKVAVPEPIPTANENQPS